MKSFAVISLLALLVMQPALAADPEATAAQIQQLKKDITRLQASIGQQTGQQRKEEEALRDAEREVGRVTSEIRSMDTELAQLEQRLSGLQQQRGELESLLDQRRELIADLLRDQYRQGRQPRLQLLLMQQDPEQLDRVLRYYDHVNSALVQQLQDYQVQLRTLEKTRQDITAAEQDRINRRESLKAREVALNQARTQRSTALKELQAALAQNQQQLVRLQSDQERLEQVLVEIQRNLERSRLSTDNQAFTERKGKLSWPLQGRVLRSYGSVRNQLSYEGLLISAAENTEVRAVHHGRVVFADWLRGYGLLLIIDHGGGYMSLYGHNQSLFREPGDWVGGGEAVAVAGNSGGHEEPALYFAIRNNGKSVNPGQWLESR
ncbi:murein hydrolase activator EnvC family protein [Nitrincola alkalilacustris]|uniref:murein hydrolase activator EnvC family protein n=1 Tax=Nitrincola alkalilacustris TaxID=1571224 RepID=UPI00124DFB7A|nr:peptidoglycan DD-metalloendopeptidase family protein [Nitrincola alkalilacustris]